MARAIDIQVLSIVAFPWCIGLLWPEDFESRSSVESFVRKTQVHFISGKQYVMGASLTYAKEEARIHKAQLD